MFRELVPLVKPGIRTIDLDAFCHDYIVKGGGKPAFLKYDGYPNSLCVSVNEEVIHGIPGDRVLKQGDIVGLDCGIDLDGFFSDQALTLGVGSVDPESERLMRVTRECLELAIGEARAGNRVNHISRAVYKHATEAGFGVVSQYCGHGVGLEVHEEPSVPNYVGPGPNPRLVPGMVLALEPMINLGSGDIRLLDDDWTVVTKDRKASAHFEHTVAILADRTEVLTQWP
jgi:methionyl aminopeptidase